MAVSTRSVDLASVLSERSIAAPRITGKSLSGPTTESGFGAALAESSQRKAERRDHKDARSNERERQRALQERPADVATQTQSQLRDDVSRLNKPAERSEPLRSRETQESREHNTRRHEHDGKTQSKSGKTETSGSVAANDAREGKAVAHDPSLEGTRETPAEPALSEKPIESASPASFAIAPPLSVPTGPEVPLTLVIAVRDAQIASAEIDTDVASEADSIDVLNPKKAAAKTPSPTLTGAAHTVAAVQTASNENASDGAPIQATALRAGAILNGKSDPEATVADASKSGALNPLQGGREATPFANALQNAHTNRPKADTEQTTTTPSLTQTAVSSVQSDVQTFGRLTGPVSTPAEAVARADAPVPLQAVAVEIGMRAMRGSKEFTIRLDPEDLGRIDIQLEISEAGEVQAKLMVDSVETLQLLQRDAKTLEKAFDQAGLKTNPDGLQFSLRDPGQQANQHQSNNQREERHQGVRSPGNDDQEPNAADEIALRSFQYRSSASRGLDIRI